MVDALIEYGMISELAGRIPTIIPLKPLEKNELMKVLTETTISPIIKQKEIFAKSGYNLMFTDEYLNGIVDKAYKSATGTRALDSYVKKSLSIASFDCLSLHKTSELNGNILIGAECISNPELYKLTKRKIVSSITASIAV
jgi:ATP-dependent protease Clp ATPase subunit